MARSPGNRQAQSDRAARITVVPRHSVADLAAPHSDSAAHRPSRNRSGLFSSGASYGWSPLAPPACRQPQQGEGLSNNGARPCDPRESPTRRSPRHCRRRHDGWRHSDACTKSTPRTRVTFHGFQPTERLAGFYARAHLHVSSSRHEGAGVVLLEAAATGLASVGTAVGYLADWSRAPSPRGVGVPAQSPDALASGIAELFGDRPDACKSRPPRAVDPASRRELDRATVRARLR